MATHTPIPYRHAFEIVEVTMRNRHHRSLWPEGTAREVALLMAAAPTPTAAVDVAADELKRRDQAPHLVSDGAGI